MKLPELRLVYCLLPLIALAQPATAITNSRLLPSDSTNPRLISKPNNRSIAKNPVQCPEGKFPVTVEAPNGNSPSYAGKLGDRVDPMTRCIFFKDVSLNIIGPARQSTKPKRTWLIIHGWLNNSESGNIKDPNDANIKKLAETVAQQRRGDRVLILDWGEAAMNRGENGSWVAEGQGSIGVYYAASWIRPVAEVAVEQLKSKYGLTGEEAANNLNIIGHSLGTLMAAEIGGIYFGLNPQGNKTGEGVPIKSIIALDPPSELSTNGSLIYNLGGYDVDGRTPAYIFKDKTLGIWSNRELRPKEIDRPKHFDRVSQFSRAFVGSKSIGGNQELAGWAHESFQMDFGSFADAGGEHGRVVRAFDNLISQSPFKQPASKSSFLDLNDLLSHSDCTQKGFIKCNAYQKDHEGVITVDSKNLPTMVQFNQSGTFAEVKIKPNEQYSYYINPGSPDSVNKAYSVTSLGGTPQIEINNFIQNSRMTGHEDVNVTLGEGRAEITTALTKNKINFIGTGEIITRNQKKWQIAKTLLPIKTPRVTARFPIAMQAEPSPMLKKAIFSPIESKFSFTLVDLNNDGNKEAIVMTRPGFCGNRSCPIKILKLDNQKKSYNLLSEDIWTSRDLNLALLPTKSNGWQDLAVTAFSYETKTIDWYAVKFDGKTYKYSSQKLAQMPQNIILSEKSREFDLRDLSSTKTAANPPTSVNKVQQIPWAKFSVSKSPDTLRQDLFRWEQGGMQQNSYAINNDVLKIVAASGTDAFPNTEPRIIYRTRGDFDVNVKVKFSSNTNYQRATLGVRSINGGAGLMRLSMLEGQRIEAGFYPENNTLVPNNVRNYPYDVAYLRIKKQNGFLIASYSADRKNWSLVLKRQMATNLQNLEVFLSVLSTDGNNGCAAEFSEFTINKI